LFDSLAQMDRPLFTGKGRENEGRGIALAISLMIVGPIAKPDTVLVHSNSIIVYALSSKHEKPAAIHYVD